MLRRAGQDAGPTIGRSADHLLILQLVDAGGGGGGGFLRNLLSYNYSVCVLARRQGFTHPPLLGEVPIVNVGGHWNKRQREPTHTRHKQHLHH